MGKLILVRHGESIWNLKNIFTGWTDIGLTPLGVEEAEIAGELIKEEELTIDICYTSYLKRAIKTALIILETTDKMHVDCIKSWKLNERNYGIWQGRNKDDVKKEVGEALFWKVRRGYKTPPPSFSMDDERHPRFDTKYSKIPVASLPRGESLEMTKQRVVQYYFECIVSKLVQGKTVLVAAHGNSIRALIGQIEQIPENEMPKVEVHTGVPKIYEFDTTMCLKNEYLLEQKRGGINLKL